MLLGKITTLKCNECVFLTKNITEKKTQLFNAIIDGGVLVENDGFMAIHGRQRRNFFFFRVLKKQPKT